MLGIERILEISKEMGITVNEDKKGLHYIIDSIGDEVVFHTDMLMNIESETSFERYELNISNTGELNSSNILYKESYGFKTSYILEPIEIDEISVIVA